MGAQHGSPEGLGIGTWVQSRRVALGGPWSGLSPQLLCKWQQPLPGNVLAGGTQASKQTDAAPAVGRRAGSRIPSALSHPSWQSEGGVRRGEHPPARSKEKGKTPSRISACWGLRSCSGATKAHHGHPGTLDTQTVLGEGRVGATGPATGPGAGGLVGEQA